MSTAFYTAPQIYTAYFVILAINQVEIKFLQGSTVTQSMLGGLIVHIKINILKRILTY